MKPEMATCLIAAVLVHALVLFGIRIETSARPLAMSDEPSSTDVSLVETAPEPPAAAPTPSEPAPAPEPASTPEPPPEPQPTPEMSTPPPMPTPDEEAIPSPESTPTEHPRSAPPHPLRKPSKPSAPHSAPGAPTPLTGATSRGAPNGPPGSSARYLSNPKPDYPAMARQMRQEGVVILSVTVGTDGHADDVSLSRSSGYPLLDQSALQTVRHWLFEPARAAGLPVSSQVVVPVRFSLSD